MATFGNCPIEECHFGAVAANNGWHRTSSLIRHTIRSFFLAPVARYVDDFFGPNTPGMRWAAGFIISKLTALMGFPCDMAKEEDDSDVRDGRFRRFCRL